MGKYFYLFCFRFFIFLLNNLKSSEAVNIECNFNMVSFVTVGTVYSCKITTNLNIKSPEDAVIANVSGTHLSGKTNDEVTGFHAYNKVIEYFPKGLEKFFKNLKVIYIPSGRFKQISQSDLKPFQNLVFIDVHDNVIEILEDGLFDNHPNMTLVHFPSNKIFHVGKNVFNNMNKLEWIYFLSNPCISMGSTDNNSTAINIIIESLKTKCFDVNFANFSQNLANLENESKILTFYTFPIWSENLANLENYFQNSRFSYLISIKERFEVLNAIKIDDFTTQNPTTISTTTEVAVTETTEQPDDCMSSNFEDLENNLSKMFTESLNQTEQNLIKSHAESCTEVNYQTLYFMKDEFFKVNEKLLEHSSEVRSEFIKNDVQHSAILTRIASLEEKLEQILDILRSGN